MEFKFIGDDEGRNVIMLHGYSFLLNEFVRVDDTLAIEALKEDQRFEARAQNNDAA